MYVCVASSGILGSGVRDIAAFIVGRWLVGIDGAVGIGSATGCIGDSYGNHFVGGFCHVKTSDFDNPLSAVQTV